MSESVTVIIPAYNRGPFLQAAVESAVAQTYRPIELVVVDDGSAEAVEPWIDRGVHGFAGRLEVLRQANQGPGKAREAGLRVARGRWVQYLDSDDLLHPEKLERQVSALEEHPEAMMAYCTTREFEETPSLEAGCVSKLSDQSFPSILPHVLSNRPWRTSSCLWERSACEQAVPCLASRHWEDWEHDCRAGKLLRPIVHLAEPLAFFRQHQDERASNAGLADPKFRFECSNATMGVFEALQGAGLLQDANLALRLARRMLGVARWLVGSKYDDRANLLLKMVLAMPGLGLKKRAALRVERAFRGALGVRVRRAIIGRVMRELAIKTASGNAREDQAVHRAPEGLLSRS